MIEHLKGRLVEFSPAHAIIECNGVGYYCHITLNTFSKLGNSEQVTLKTHLVIREDAHSLYGFYDENERTMFRLLISVSGVGASTGRMILSALSPGELAAAIDSENNLQTQLDEFGKQNIKTFAKEFSKQYSKSPKQFYMINGASSGAQISVEDFKNLRKIIQTSVGDKSSPVNNETMYYFLRTLLFLSANFFKKIDSNYQHAVNDKNFWKKSSQ